MPRDVKSYADYLETVYKRSQLGGGQERLHVKIHRYINLWTVCEIEDNEEDMCVEALMQAEIEKVKKLKKPITISQVCVYCTHMHSEFQAMHKTHLPHVI